MENTDSILIGTEWIKTSAKHHGQKARIEKTTNRGPMFRFIGQPILHRHGGGQSNQQFMRISWAEVGLNWQPADKDSESRYQLWRAASRVEYLDKKLEELDRDLVPEDFIDTSETARPGEAIFGLRQEIESTNPIMTPVVIPDNSGVPTEVACSSVYHKPAKALVPVGQAYMTRQNNWVCLDCKAKREEYGRKQAARMRAAKAAKQKVVTLEPPPPLEILPVEELPIWKITVVLPTVLTVRARDFLEAAAQVAEKGEIVKVEKL